MSSSVFGARESVTEEDSVGKITALAGCTTGALMAENAKVRPRRADPAALLVFSKMLLLGVALSSMGDRAMDGLHGVKELPRGTATRRGSNFIIAIVSYG